MTTDRPVGPPAPPRIDPRIRQRRIAVRRDQGRRRLRRLMIALGTVAVVTLVVIVAHSPVLDVDAVEVRGGVATEPSVVLDVAGIERGDPMVRLDVGAATERIESLPWVDQARIRRDYPGRVEIELTERVPVGILRHGDTEFLVDGTGRVLGPVRLGFGDLARLVIDEPPPAAGSVVTDEVREALSVLADVSGEIDGHTVVVAVEDDGLRLTVDGELVVDLGPATRVDAKLRAVATVLAEVDLTCAELIDVRSPQRPVLTREEPCQ